MEIEELQDFADWENERIERFQDKSNDDMKPFSLIKLSEEAGEFANEALKTMGFQRKEKMEDVDTMREKLEEELADVILVAILAGRRFGIDIESAISKKIEKIRRRNYK